jgi:sn-2 palmitoyl-lipid 9-desaturase
MSMIESEQLTIAKRPKPLSHTSSPSLEPDANQLAAAAWTANSAELWHKGIDWPVVVWIAMVHILALAAPFYFSWQGLVTCGVLVLATGSLGVCMGYHRLLTHGSFKTYRPVRWLLAFLGGLSGEGSALTWVANHRKHHVHSDKEGDPHSPRDGAWWSRTRPTSSKTA